MFRYLEIPKFRFFPAVEGSMPSTGVKNHPRLDRASLVVCADDTSTNPVHLNRTELDWRG